MRLDHLLSKGFCIFGPRARWAWHAVGFWGGAPWCPGPRPPSSRVGGLGVVGGLVVNCIVDASIDIVVLRFVVVVVRLCVLCVDWFVGFERSVDALASGADEGRGGLRYASGSRLAGCDPRVSEWGDPAPVVGRHPCLKFIGRGG